jgi:hypothetical protein
MNRFAPVLWAVCLCGLPHADALKKTDVSSPAYTIPIDQGNQWTYVYRDSTGSGYNGVPGTSWDSITTVGILSLTIKTSVQRADSAFFSVAFSDSGTRTYRCSGCIPAQDSVYGFKRNTQKDYLKVGNVICSKDSLGQWVTDSNPLLSLTPDTNSTKPMVVHIGNDSTVGHTRVDRHNTPLMDGIASAFDSVCWADSIGLVGRTSDSSSLTAPTGWTKWAWNIWHYTLVSYRITSNTNTKFNLKSLNAANRFDIRQLPNRNIVVALHLPPAGARELNIGIFNVAGKRAYSATTGPTNSAVSIPASGFPAGIYYVSITDGTGSLVSEAFALTK